MNIQYLHGLDSKLTPEKKSILESFGNVFAPDLDYYTIPDTIANLVEEYDHAEIDVVIGSSMGGFAGYHLSNHLDRPALLFNPALKRRSVLQNIPEPGKSSEKLKQLVIGQQDEVVSPQDTLGFISEQIKAEANIHVHLMPSLAHRIPLEEFEFQVDSFFKKL